MAKLGSGRSPSGPGCQPSASNLRFSRSGIPIADLAAISAWPERRPPRTEEERAAIANRLAAHLPNPPVTRVIGDDDLNAMRAAFIRRFDEQLPRTETLMAVAHVGYRMAIRDMLEASDG